MKTGLSDTRRLFYVYLSAIAVLLGSVVITMFITEMSAFQLADDAKAINTSGRQRMLSQRILYLAQDLEMQRRSGRENDLRADVAELNRAIDLFEASHDALNNQSAYGPFYANTVSGISLDDRLRSFISSARDVAQGTGGVGRLERLKELERQGLLRDLNEVVTAIEAASIARVSTLQTAGRISVAIAIVIIFVEMIFVFLPGHRLIERAMRGLRERNRALETLRGSLSMQNRKLEISNAAIEVERRRVERALQESETLRNEQVAFTYAVSHDLKSPANTMHLVLEELAEHCDDCLDDQARDLIRQGRATVSRMSEQVEDVLSYAQATELRAEPETIDLAEVIDDVLAHLKGDITACDAQVTVGRTVRCRGFREQIFSLIQNLISNALKYHVSGVRPEIAVSSAEFKDGPGVMLDVSDNGIGIAAENQRKIFDLFKRLHLRSEYPGSGLGLSTCARIARNHNGEISVISRLGQGSTFRVLLRDPGTFQSDTKEAA